jgi:hypothetical protein
LLNIKAKSNKLYIKWHTTDTTVMGQTPKIKKNLLITSERPKLKFLPKFWQYWYRQMFYRYLYRKMLNTDTKTETDTEKYKTKLKNLISICFQFC